MNWESDVSQNTHAVMRMLGNFGPTVNVAERCVKGWLADDDGGGKAYWDATELREMAQALHEVADWLDRRAAQAHP